MQPNHNQHSHRPLIKRWLSTTLEHRLKTFEMRWPEVEPALLPGIGMGGAKGFRVRPGLECRRTVPRGMRNEHRCLGIAGSLKQMKMSKARHAGQVAVALAPDLDEFGLTAGRNAKSIHGDEHGCEFRFILSATPLVIVGAFGAQIRQMVGQDRNAVGSFALVASFDRCRNFAGISL
jgi:hypothetical protein